MMQNGTYSYVGTVFRFVWLSLFGAMLFSCSGLSLDKESNCRNSQAACFKADKTAPKVDFFETQPLRDSNNNVTALQYIDVTFSEEVKNGELASQYGFKPNPTVHNFSVTSVQRISAYTYRLHVGGALLNSGSIELDLSRLTDYNGNILSSVSSVQFGGSVNIGIVSSVNHNGVSPGGYTSVDIQFYHTYTADVANANNYTIRLTSGAIDCVGGTQLTSGSNLAPGVANAVTLNVPHTSFSPGMNRLVICVNNLNNPNAANSASWPIIHDSTAPVLNFTPAAGSYAQPKQITLACGNNMDKIAYTSASQQTTTPADPAPPVFNAATGAITTGSLYSAPLTAANPMNPTYTKYLWRCIDIAGNQSAAPTTVEYYIDSTIPDVVVNLDSSFRQHISAVNPATTLTFSTDQVSKTYNIRRNGTHCNTGGDGTLLATGTTAAVAGQTTSVVLDETTHFNAANNVTYPVRICVAGTGIQWGTAYLEITRDNTVPTISATVLSGNYGALQNVEFTCDDGFGVVDKVAYNLTEADGITVPAAPANPDFNTSTGVITSGQQQSGAIAPADRKTSRYAFRCIDRAGNRSAVGNTQYTIDATLPVVNFVSANRVAVTTNAGGYNDVTLIWSASRELLTYRIRRVGDCDHAGTPANTIATGTIAAVNVNQSAMLPATSFPSNGTTYPVRICVYNFVNASVYQATPVSITRDDTPPVIAAPDLNPAIATVNTTTFTLSWNAATDAGGSGVAGYRIYRSLTSNTYPGYPGTPDYTATSSPATISLPDTQKYFLRIVPVDTAGNIPTAPPLYYNEIATRLVLSVAVAGYASAVPDFRISQSGNTLGYTSNVTQSFPTVFSPGDSYSISITNQPGGQHCAFVQNQYGIMNADTTLNVTCVSGYISGGGMIANTPMPMNYMLYRGNSPIVAGGGIGTTCTGTNTANCSNGGGTSSTYNNPHGMTIVNGSVYIADRGNHRIRRYVASTNTTSTFAGEGTQASVDGTGLTTAQFNTPNAITTDGTNLYVGELNTGRIRKIEIATQNVTTIAGGGALAGGVNCPGVVQAACLDGTGLQANFGQINDLDYHNGYLYISDYSLARIRRLNLTTGQVDTIAGSGNIASTDNATGIAASFQNVGGAAVVGGDLYVLDINGHRVRRVSLSAPFAVTTVAGTGTLGFMDGAASTARFHSPDNMATDGRNLFIAEFGGNRLRRLDLTKNIVSTIAGSGVANDVSGTGVAASFNGPVGIVSDGARLFAGSFNAGRIFRIADQGLVGYWPLGASGNDYASHITTPSNLSPSASAPTQTTGRYNEAAGAHNFAAASNQHFQQTTFTNLPMGTTNSTMCAWIKPSSLPAAGASMVIVGYGGAVSHSMRVLSLFNNSGTHHISFRSLGSTVSFPYTVSTTLWTHVCTTFSHVSAGTQWVTIFANGHNLGVADTATDLNTTTGSVMRIGGNLISGDVYFDGTIADVRIYNRALNHGEISELAQDALAANVGAGFNARPTGLLSHYSFDPVGATPTLADSGSLGYDLTIGSAPTATSGKDGDTNGAFSYAGTQYLLSSATAVGLPAGVHPRTICAWINPASHPGAGGWMSVVAYGPNTINQQVAIATYNTGTRTVANFETENAAAQIQGTSPITLGSWSHICATIDAAGQAVLYLNGYNEGSTTLTALATLSSTALYLSADVVPGQLPFAGKIDDIRIYNNALNQTQIRQLAAQVPAGLVAHYDFTTDRNDISGFGQHLGNNGVTATGDRFGVLSTASAFNGSSYFDGATAGFPAGNSPRTICAWTNPSALGGIFSEVVVYGSAASGYGLGMDANRIFVLDAAGDLIFNKPHGLNIWRHICVTYDGSIEGLHLDGALVTAAVRTVNTPSGTINIGRHTNGSDYFSGAIDDVRIYNRALAVNEIQAIVQQPNKRIFVTAAPYTGNLGGISGADAKCTADASKPVTGTYKAMIVDGASRVACTTNNCTSSGLAEHIDWVLRPNITYVRAASVTPIFLTDFRGVFPFGTLTNPIITGLATAWTGLTTGWQVATGGSELDCTNWTDGSGVGTAATGRTDLTSSGAIFQTTQTCNNTTFLLYCVEQ